MTTAKNTIAARDPAQLVNQHTSALKKETLEQLRLELIALQSENSSTIERLRLVGASLQRRAERIGQQRDLLEEVNRWILSIRHSPSLFLSGFMIWTLWLTGWLINQPIIMHLF
jgi:hypothetical protein